MPPKRKRNDRPSVDGNRPSPHRPGDTNLGQHDRDDGHRIRGRGHRGSSQRRNSSHSNSGHVPSGHPSPSQRTTHSNSTMPPPPAVVPPQPSLAAADPKVAMGSPPKLNHRYDNLTDDVVQNWVAQGRQKILQHGVQSREDVDITELSSLFQEFAYAAVEQRLNALEAGNCVKQIVGDETSELIKDSFAVSPQTLFLDSLAVVTDSNPALLQPSLRAFLESTGIPVELMRQVLDAPVLQQLGLIRDNFTKVGVRQATNLLYRQANYNLLREESEGYSKLINELYPTNNPQAEQTFERVKALIGTFDLDVGRVLDIVLDVAASILMKQYRFFVKFLRASSWWPRSQPGPSQNRYLDGLPIWALPGHPMIIAEDEKIELAERRTERDVAFWARAKEVHLTAFFELGGRKASDEQLARLTNGAADDMSSSTVPTNDGEWVAETKTLPPPGNRVAAHLLGFKLSYYHSDLRAKDEVLPANLLWLAALLVKIGFISLVDLYPHLSPSDDDMEQVRKRQLDKIEEEERASRGGAMNALLMAGELPQGEDDNPASFGQARKEPTKRSEPAKKTAAATEGGEAKPDDLAVEQKGTFLIQLLTIGALPEALFILGRFPWMTEAFPEVLDRIHRILHVMLEKVFEQTKPVATVPLDRFTRSIPAVDQSGMPKGSVRLKQLPPKAAMRWPHPDVADNEENLRYSFYWEDWADNIPLCQTVDDVFTLCDTFLNLSGVSIGKDEALLSKLASIGAKSLADDQSSANFERWHSLLKRLLVPALCHTKANASVVNKVWEILSQYPTTTRYSIYAECYEGQISRLPAMKAAFARATAETRGVMKRVSLTNLGEMAKKLAKISYASPGIVFKVGLGQLESYSNLIEAFVECAKYFTEMSYDVLVWSLLTALGKSRSRTQEDHALTVSGWLAALSKFSGRVFRRYQHLDSTPVLQYVNDQLYQGNSTDLIILNEFLSSMGGIEDYIDFTEYQVLSLAGGPCLRRHTLIRAQDKRYESLRSSRRLMEALKRSNLAAVLLINLAQFRQNVIFQVPEDEAHIKYLSDTVDKAHTTLTRYNDFLWSNMEPLVFDAQIPPLKELISSYGLDVSLAFSIRRANLLGRMFPWKSDKSDKASSDKEGDVSMVDSEQEEPDDSTGNDEVKADDSSLFGSTLQPVIDAVRDTQSPDLWKRISPDFFTTFWTLQLGDLFCPDKSYRQEREYLKKEELAISRDRTDMSRRGQERKVEKRKELTQLQINLSEECGEHLLRQAKLKFQLSKLYQSAFPLGIGKAAALADTLLEQCFIPRAMLSMADAEYTFKFIKSLHEQNAPGFKLMALYDRLFNANRLRSLIFTCTTREAEYFGHLLKRILEDLSRWHKNEPVLSEGEGKAAQGTSRPGTYEKEGKGTGDQPHLGFAETFTEDGKPLTFVEHDQFKDVLFRWHRGLNMGLKACLSGTEWMHIRNAITVLRSVVDFFPAVDFMANQFTSQLQRIFKAESADKKSVFTEEGGRVDLATSAQGAMSEMQKRKSKWVMVQAFRPNANGNANTDAEKPSASLRPTAPEFKPDIKSKTATTEEEDGEVKDAREKALAAGTAPRSNQKESLPPKPTAPEPQKQVRASGDIPRSSTPKTAGSTPSASRPESRPHTLPERPPQGLPSRPDVPIPAHPSHHQNRGNDRHDGREPRDPRPAKDSRDTREGKDTRDNPDHRDVRTAEADRPGRGDLPPRPGAPDRERERSHRDSRGGRPNERDTPGGQASNHHDPLEPKEPLMNPERAALFSHSIDERPQRTPTTDRRSRIGRSDTVGTMDSTVNPDRAALIGEPRDQSSHRTPRDVRGSRPGSPRRGGSSGAEPREPPPPFGGHRVERMASGPHTPATPAERLREASSGHRSDSVPRGIHQDQNYGRLNSVPSGPEIPSGPRGRGRAGVRGPPDGYAAVHATPSPADTRADNTTHTGHTSTPDRPPPTGPSMSRGRSGPGGGATPASTPEVPIHPDRMRSLGVNGDTSKADLAASTPAGVGVHPDRLAQMSQQSPHTPVSRPPPSSSQYSTPVSQSHDRSRGPLRHPGVDQGFIQGGGSHATSEAAVPTGPAATSERSRGGGGRRQLAGIQSTLQASVNKPDVSRNNGNSYVGGGPGNNNINSGNNNNNGRRGQQPRQMLANSDVQILTGGSPATTPAAERPDPHRSDSGSRPHANDGADAHHRLEDRGHRDRDQRADRPRRERDTEHASSRDRNSQVQGNRDNYRDRRSGMLDDGHPDGRGNRPNRDVGGPTGRVGAGVGGGELFGAPPVPPPPPMMGRGPRDMMAPKDPRQSGGGGGGGGGGPREHHAGRGGGWHSGGPGHAQGQQHQHGLGRGSGRLEDRPRDDRGRKRRSEEGVGGGMGNEREKRPRR